MKGREVVAEEVKLTNEGRGHAKQAAAAPEITAVLIIDSNQ